MDSPEPVKTHYVRCLKCKKVLECSRYDSNALLEHIRTDHPEIEVVDVDEYDTKDTKPNPNGYRSTNEHIKTNNGSNGYNTMQHKRPSVREAAHNIVRPPPTYITPFEPRGKETKEKMFEPTISSKSEDFEEFKSKSTPTRERLHIRQHRIDEPPTRDETKCDCGVLPESSNDTTSAAYTRRIHTPASQTPRIDQHTHSLYRTSIEKWRPANGTIYCPKCGANRRPLIRTQAERSSNNSCCAVCILGCWPFCFLPFLVPSDNKEYLHCSNCKSFLGLYDRANNCVKPNREYLIPEDMNVNETPDDDCKERRNCRCA